MVYASDQAHSFDPQGGSARRIRSRAPAPHRDRPGARAAARPAAAGRGGGPCGRAATLRRGRRGRHDRDHGSRPGGRRRRPLRAPRHVAARRRRPRRYGDDLPGVPLDVGGRRARRLRRLQPAQVDGYRLRPLRLLRARPRAPRARDEHQSELPAHRPRRRGAQPARLGYPVGPPLPLAQAVVPPPRVRSGRPAGPRPPRRRQRRMACGARRSRRRSGNCSRRRRSRPCVCGTCRRRSPATRRRSPRTTPKSSSASTTTDASTTALRSSRAG